MMTDKYKETRQRWDRNNREIIRRSKAKYNAKNPVFSFRTTPELLEWLEAERQKDENGKPENNSDLIIRKLEKLMKMEKEGYE